MKQRVIAIIGGIGVGKTVVSTVLSKLGYSIYDCDSNAKRLMDNSDAIKRDIAFQISNEAIVNNQIDRKVLASIVFNDEHKLEKLNKITHSAVKDDIIQWIGNSNDSIKFIETAILYQSGLDKIVDEVWEVTAPMELRISRVMSRNNISRQDVISRINSQLIEIENPHPNIKQIVNDLYTPIIPQILKLI